MTTPQPQPTQFEPVAGLLACLLPGLGYAYFVDVRRAIYVFAGVVGLYGGGLLVGGISVVDRVDNKWWFYLQCGAGPVNLVVDTVNQQKKRLTQAGPSPETSYTQALGRVSDVGALSAGLGGMMNLIAVIDCFFHPPRPRRTRKLDPVPTL